MLLAKLANNRFSEMMGRFPSHHTLVGGLKNEKITLYIYRLTFIWLLAEA